MLRAAIICENAVWRAGLRQVLSHAELQLVAVHSSVAEAIRPGATPAADVAFVALRDPGDLGAVEVLKRALPATALVVIGLDSRPAGVPAALSRGASGCLGLTPSREDLLLAARAAAQGYAVIDRALLVGMGRPGGRGAEPSDAGWQALTPREREVLRLLSQGLGNRQIAARLDVAVSTVRAHVSHILAKLGLHDRVRAAVWAAEHGLAPSAPAREQPGLPLAARHPHRIAEPALPYLSAPGMRRRREPLSGGEPQSDGTDLPTVASAVLCSSAPLCVP